jgi:Uma2 family endonuclease
MSEILELQEQEEQFQDEVDGMPSKKHSTVQTNITGLLFNDDRFKPFIELSLDASQIDLTQFGLKTKDELIPDICVYVKKKPPIAKPELKSKPKRLDDDILKVSAMPSLAIEVLSPRQTITELLNKFNAFFALGIQSCWLVMPSIEIIKIYSQQGAYKSFDMNDTEIVDEVLDIHLPIQKIFDFEDWILDECVDV